MCILVDSDSRCMDEILKSEFHGLVLQTWIRMLLVSSDGGSEWTIRYEDRERVSFSLRLYDSSVPA